MVFAFLLRIWGYFILAFYTMQPRGALAEW